LVGIGLADPSARASGSAVCAGVTVRNISRIAQVGVTRNHREG
jgi:hypothetical protein